MVRDTDSAAMPSAAFRYLFPGRVCGGLDPAGGLVLAGADAGPGREPARGVEHGHVGAGLGDDHVGDRDGDARDRGQHVPGGTKGLHRLLDPGGEPVDHRGLRVDLVRYSPTMNAWCSVNRPVQRVDELRDLVPQRAFRELRRGRRGSRSPATSASSIARDGRAGQVPTTTEESLIPEDSRNFSRRCTCRVRSLVAIARARVRSRSCRIGSGGTNDARSSPCAASCASQAASDTSVLRPGMFLACRGVDQHHRQRVFHQEVERLPVVAGRFHHHRRDLLRVEELDQVQDLRPWSHPRSSPSSCNVPARLPGHPDRDLRVAFGDIHPRRPLMHHIHDSRSFPYMSAPAAGRAGNKLRNLTLVLEGNNPRFPWVPFRATLATGSTAPRDLDVTATGTTSIHLDNPGRQEPATHETPDPHGAAAPLERSAGGVTHLAPITSVHGRRSVRYGCGMTGSPTPSRPVRGVPALIAAIASAIAVPVSFVFGIRAALDGSGSGSAASRWSSSWGC